MRRYLPGFLLVLSAVGPFTLLGCDDLIAKLKGGTPDAGADAAAAVAVAAEDPDAAAAAAVAAAAAAAAATTAAAPTGTLAAAPTGTVRPVLKTDAGVVLDAGAAKKADGGPAPAPAPTPTPTFPTNLFDAGGLFKFDAGGFKPPFPIPR